MFGLGGQGFSQEPETAKPTTGFAGIGLNWRGDSTMQCWTSLIRRQHGRQRAKQNQRLSSNPIMASTKDKLKCGHFTEVERKLHFTTDVTQSCRFWTEGVISSGIAVCGLLGNLVSIWILSVPQMRTNGVQSPPIGPGHHRLHVHLAWDCHLHGQGLRLASRVVQQDVPLHILPFVRNSVLQQHLHDRGHRCERYIGLCRPLQRLSGRPCSAKAYIIPGRLNLTLQSKSFYLGRSKYLGSGRLYQKSKGTL